MSRLLVHPGTGTIVDIDDDWFYFVLPDDLAEADDDEIVGYGAQNGRNMRLWVSPDVSYGNIICYSPSSLREEARVMLDDCTDSLTREALEFVIRDATDEELDDVASYILNADDVWDSFRNNVLEGARQGLDWSREKKS